MSKTKSLLETVRALPAAKRKHFRRYLPPDVAQQLRQIATERKEGKIPAHMADIRIAVLKELKSRGIESDITLRAFMAVMADLAE